VEVIETHGGLFSRVVVSNYVIDFLVFQKAVGMDAACVMLKSRPTYGVLAGIS
jgi:hypothetical protein